MPELIGPAVIFGLLTASILKMGRNNALLRGTVLGESALTLLLWHKGEHVAIFAVSRLFGSLAEVAFVRGGMWSYANPTLWGVPIWSLPAFATAALCAQRLARTITALWVNMQSRAKG